MRIRIGKSIVIFMMVLAVLATAAYQVSTYAGSVEEIEKKQQQAKDDALALKKEQQEQEARKKELQAAKAELEASLGELNSDLQIISKKISDLEDEIAGTQSDILQVKAELEQAQKKADEQYESMKLRIQYMYENGNVGMFDMLLESGNIAEFLNRINYISELSGYDRGRLEEYENTTKQIASDKKKLEKKQSSLKKKQEKLGVRQEELAANIDRLQDKVASAKDDEAKQQKKLEELEGKIAAMNKYEEELKKQKAEAAARQQQEEQKEIEKAEQEMEQPVEPGNYSDSDYQLLAALIYCEAGGTTYECQLAVGTVVMNRIQSSHFPNSLTGVVYQSGQFSPAASGRLAVVLENGLATASCKNAAKAVLGGKRTGNWLYFCYNTGSINGTVIGTEVFY